MTMKVIEYDKKLGLHVKYAIMNCIDGMKQYVADESVDLILTSPPYQAMRSYNGHVDDFDFPSIASQLVRTIKPQGCIVWITDDQTNESSESLSSFKQAIYFHDVLGMCVETMIYQKSNSRYPAKHRCPHQFEYMFVFSKGVPKTYNPLLRLRKTRQGEMTMHNRDVDGTVKKVLTRYGGKYISTGDVWKYDTGPNSGTSAMDVKTMEQGAVFPDQLAIDHINTWSNPGDIIMDPMVGSGTTLAMAMRLRRNAIGFEIDEKCGEYIEHRLRSSDSRIDDMKFVDDVSSE